MVEMITKWFGQNMVDARYNLLNTRFVPNFESWRHFMNQLLKPYVSH